MTVERLKELFEQGGVVGYPTWSGGFHEIKLDKNLQRLDFNCVGRPVLIVGLEDGMGYTSIDVEWLREDVDRARWEVEMHKSVILDFDPPFWKDIDKSYRFKFTWRDLCIRFVVLKFVNTIKIEDDNECGEVYFNEPATEENYVKACKIVSDLFTDNRKEYVEGDY